ncbi:unnamed protein product, partial [Effrenium voratum]
MVPWRFLARLLLAGLATRARSERVALCVLGRIRAAHVTAEAFRRNLLDPLCGGSCRYPRHRLDIFLSGPLMSASQLQAASELFGDGAAFPWLVRGVRFQDESLVVDDLNRRFGDALHQAMRIRGNWLGTSGRRLSHRRLERRKGATIFIMYAMHQCLHMIEERELEASAMYDRVAITRSDLQWIFPHPPLEALAPMRVWLPDTFADDYGGVYDRHLLAPRSAARWVLGGWDLLTSGQAYRTILQVTGEGILWSNNTNSEVWLAIRLLAGKVPLARFPATAYLACDRGEFQASAVVRRGDTASEDRTDHTTHGAFNNVGCEPGGFRYHTDHAAARLFAACLQNSTAATADSAAAWAHGARQCFCRLIRPDLRQEYEKLAIFGNVKARRGAELKVLSAVETKVPGYFEKIRDDVVYRDKNADYGDGSWGTETMTFQDDELSYALGKQGGTRKKIERSSGAIVQYVGQVLNDVGRTSKQASHDLPGMCWADVQSALGRGAPRDFLRSLLALPPSERHPAVTEHLPQLQQQGEAFLLECLTEVAAMQEPENLAGLLSGQLGSLNLTAQWRPEAAEVASRLWRASNRSRMAALRLLQSWE